ncbi:MAG TPA: hypothetical protein VG755_32560 [Nannocystaceae bacterium]|nr:hypothetical protein [Nannocystaceae bacterium]
MAERVVALALVLACACGGAARDETKVEIVAASERPTPVAAPPLPDGDPAYELWVGPVVSPSDPRLVDELDRVPIGFAGIAFRLAGPGSFAITEIEVTLAMIEGSALAELTRKRSPLGKDEDIFFKSWKLSQPGTYQVTVSDPRSGAVLAARRFEVASDAATKRVRTPVSPPFQLTIGPATSPTDPKPVKTETKVPIGYVGMRFAPPPDGKLTTPRIAVTLWRIEGDTRVLEARKVDTLGAADEVFYKSWELTTTGIYEVEVADPDSPTLFATTRFETIPAAAP